MVRVPPAPSPSRLAWLVLGATLSLTAACNPGQCLRQSDCPLGSTCKKGMCQLASKPSSPQKDAGGKSPTTAPARSSTDQEATLPSASNDAALSDPSTASEQSSNLDGGSDTATTLSR